MTSSFAPRAIRIFNSIQLQRDFHFTIMQKRPLFEAQSLCEAQHGRVVGENLTAQLANTALATISD
jgi:hypothetical protein